MSDQDECPKCGRTATGNWKRLGSPPIHRWRCVCGDVFTTVDLLRTQLGQLTTENEGLREALKTLPLSEYGEAQQGGCDANGAMDCLFEAIDAHVKAALEAPTDEAPQRDAPGGEGDSHE